ncbi:4Fe-4S dicluster domain-containing protein [Candidatus Bathyarchaeota archaeon]|nr:4Fe-4S dicluster domain-containing protein [Candidatus Bathyarchaeota archaeon]MBT7186861.1 4Fe-4S dicluster domain-containing protein [Candidatus Bathyarchaeota archaeon]
MSSDKISFTNLIDDVVDQNRCVACGACDAVCPVNVIKLDNFVPTLTGDCIECGICYNNCPRTDFDDQTLEESIHGRTRNEGERLTGVYSEVYAAKAIPSDIQERAQDGGVVTALVSQFLDEGGDAVIVAGLDEERPWLPKPVVARARKEVVQAAGTKYTPSPTLLGLKKAVKEDKLEKVAVVGTPCQMRGLTRLTIGPMKNVKYRDAVDLKVGLFCMETFSHDSFIEYLGENDVDPANVTKFEIKKGRFYAHAGEERLHRARLKKVKGLIRSCCDQCEDFASEYADISVGNVASPPGYSTVLVRTERGKQALESAIKSGLIEAGPIEDFEKGETLVHKLAEMKKSSH